jgi:hypothetical protein
MAKPLCVLVLQLFKIQQSTKAVLKVLLCNTFKIAFGSDVSVNRCNLTNELGLLAVRSFLLLRPN